MERKFLKPNAFAPVPLSENFWRVLVSTGDDESSPAVGSSQAAIRADNVEAEVRRVLHEKRNVVDDAVLKQVKFCYFLGFFEIHWNLEFFGTYTFYVLLSVCCRFVLLPRIVRGLSV